MGNSDQLRSPAALSPVSNGQKGWMGLRFHLDVVPKRRTLPVTEPRVFIP